MTESETQYCDSCKKDTAVKTMHYFSSDKHLCNLCIYTMAGKYQRLLEFVKDQARLGDDIYALENSDDFGDSMLALYMRDARKILREIGELK